MMKRSFYLLLGLFLIVGVATTVAADPLGDCSPTLAGCPATPTPQPSGGNHNPGDPDGDGIPNGIDQCPDESGPSSNSGCPIGRSFSAAHPQVVLTTPDFPGLLLPYLSPTGNCVLATRTPEGVNVHNQPSIHSPVVGILDPRVPYLVIAILHNSEGFWYQVIPGWVAKRVVRFGGNCDTLPVIEQRDAVNGANTSLEVEIQLP